MSAAISFSSASVLCLSSGKVWVMIRSPCSEFGKTPKKVFGLAHEVRQPGSRDKSSYYTIAARCLSSVGVWDRSRGRACTGLQDIRFAPHHRNAKRLILLDLAACFARGVEFFGFTRHDPIRSSPAAQRVLDH